MRRRTIDFIEARKTFKQNPGPGSYHEVGLDPKTGRFAVSKYADAKFAKINPGTERF